MKNVMLAALAGTMMTGAAFAAAHSMAMGDVDTDGDNMVSMEEYDGGLGANIDARYKSYDTDGDGNVTADEFRQAEFKRYNRDRDSSLNEEEYGMFSGDDEVFGDS